MNQCIRITFQVESAKDVLHSQVQKKAKALGLEGMAQAVDTNQVKIIACGSKEAIELFIDFLHEQAAHSDLKNIEIEPMLKERDFRGAFRIIE